MGAKIPSVLMDFNTILNGDSYAGIANKITLPPITMKTVDYDGTGMTGSGARDVGKMDKQQLAVTLSDYNSNMVGLVGSRDSKDNQLIFKGALDRNGDIKACKVTCSGYWSGATPADWTPGVEATMDFTVELDYYKLEIDDKIIWEIDRLNNKFIGPDGVDRNQKVNEALGL